MNQVWLTPLTPTEKLVLLNLASHGNDGGQNAYPGVQRIAAQTGLTRRAVQKTLRHLADKGNIAAVGRGGRGTVRYALVLDRLGDREPRSQSKAHDREPRSQSATPDCEPRSRGGEPRSRGGRTTFAEGANHVRPIR